MGKGGSSAGKCKCSLTPSSQAGKGVPWKEPPGPKPLLGQTSMTGVATSGLCQPFSGAHVCYSRRGHIKGTFLSTKLSVKPRHDSSKPGFSALPVLPQCTGKPTENIPLHLFSPANPRGLQPTLCHISLGMNPHNSAAALGVPLLPTSRGDAQKQPTTLRDTKQLSQGPPPSSSHVSASISAVPNPAATPGLHSTMVGM